MKAFCFLARRSAVILTVSLACSVPALAQSTTSQGSSGSGAGSGTASARDTNDNDRDYGWLGLLGLAGLLGMRRRRDDHTGVNRSTSRSR
jgi:MYXO-CTERM domain-containing protein